jgi:hypothetical protein
MADAVFNPPSVPLARSLLPITVSRYVGEGGALPSCRTSGSSDAGSTRARRPAKPHSDIYLMTAARSIQIMSGPTNPSRSSAPVGPSDHDRPGDDMEEPRPIPSTPSWAWATRESMNRSTSRKSSNSRCVVQRFPSSFHQEFPHGKRTARQLARPNAVTTIAEPSQWATPAESE